MHRPHGIMFHHFHNAVHYKGQGSIDAETFEKILLTYKDRLLPAKEWYHKAVSGTLDKGDMCLTFDDALLCQYDVALPVMERHGLTAFWFVYTSVIEGNIEKLEIYRKFRHLYFDDIDNFYRSFFDTVEHSPLAEKVEASLIGYSHDDYAMYPFYTPNDTKFRYVRDTSLSPEEYDDIMNRLMAEHRVDVQALAANLWMEEKHIRSLVAKGHVVGLHSHSHPTNLARLPIHKQKEEYEKNRSILASIIGKPPKTVAHPADSYNENILRILQNMGVRLGFEASMNPRKDSLLTMPRIDHTIFVKELHKKSR